MRSSVQSFFVTSFLTLRAMKAGKPKQMKVVSAALRTCTALTRAWGSGATGWVSGSNTYPAKWKTHTCRFSPQRTERSDANRYSPSSCSQKTDWILRLQMMKHDSSNQQRTLNVRRSFQCRYSAEALR